MSAESDFNPNDWIVLPENWDADDTEVLTVEEKEDRNSNDAGDAGIEAKHGSRLRDETSDNFLMAGGGGLSGWLAGLTVPGALRGSPGSAMKSMADIYLFNGDFKALSWARLKNSPIFVRVLVVNDSKFDIQGNGPNGAAKFDSKKGDFPTYIAPRSSINAGQKGAFGFSAGNPTNFVAGWAVPSEILGGVSYKINGSVFTIGFVMSKTKQNIGIAASGNPQAGWEAAKSGDAKLSIGDITIEAKVEKNDAVVYVS